MSFQINPHFLFLSVMTLCCCIILFLISNLTNRKSIQSLFNKQHESTVSRITFVAVLALLFVIAYASYYLTIAQHQTLGINVFVYCLISGFTICFILFYCQSQFVSLQRQVFKVVSSDSKQYKELTESEINTIQQLLEVAADSFNTSWFILLGLTVYSIAQFFVKYTILVQNEKTEEEKQWKQSNYNYLIKLNQIDYQKFLDDTKMDLNSELAPEFEKLQELNSLIKSLKEQKSEKHKQVLETMFQNKNVNSDETNNEKESEKLKEQQLQRVEQIVEEDLNMIMNSSEQLKSIQNRLKSATSESEQEKIIHEQFQAQTKLSMGLQGLNLVATGFRTGLNLVNLVSDKIGFADFMANTFPKLKGVGTSLFGF